MVVVSKKLCTITRGPGDVVDPIPDKVLLAGATNAAAATARSALTFEAKPKGETEQLRSISEKLRSLRLLAEMEAPQFRTRLALSGGQGPRQNRHHQLWWAFVDIGIA